jgi:hypothetical protein
MTNTEVVDRFKTMLAEKTALRCELEPALEIGVDPLITIRHLTPAGRESRVNDEGTGLLWFRRINCVVFLSAEGSKGREFKKRMGAASESLGTVFINDDDGGDYAVDEAAVWYATYSGVRRPGESLSKDEENEGSWNWNEAWDVSIYVPETAFA